MNAIVQKPCEPVEEAMVKKLKALNHELSMLLENPQPGLATWQGAVCTTILAMAEEVGV